MNIGENKTIYVDSLLKRNYGFSKPITESTIGEGNILNKYKYLITNIMGSNRDVNLLKFRERLIESTYTNATLRFPVASDINLNKLIHKDINSAVMSADAFIEKCESDSDIKEEIKGVEREVRKRVIEQIDNTNTTNASFKKKVEEMETEINNKVLDGEIEPEDRDKEMEKGKEKIEESHKKTLVNSLTESLTLSIAKNYESSDLEDDRLLSEDGNIEIYRVTDYAIEAYLFLETINALKLTGNKNIKEIVESFK